MTASISKIFRYSKTPVVLLASQQAARFSGNGYGQAVEGYREGLRKQGLRCITVMPLDERESFNDMGLKRNDVQEDFTLDSQNPFRRAVSREQDKTSIYVKAYQDETGPVLMIGKKDPSGRGNVLAEDAYTNTDRLTAREASAQGGPLFQSRALSQGFMEYNLALAELAKVLRESDPNTSMIFHGNDHGTALASSLIAMEQLMPVVYGMHNPLYESTITSEQAGKLGINPAFYGRKKTINLNLLAANLANTVLTVSPSFAQELASGSNPLFTDGNNHRNFAEVLSPRMKDGSFLGILNALPERFLGRQEPVKYLPGDELRLLWANRPAAEKSFAEFLEALKILAQDSTLSETGLKLKVEVLSGRERELDALGFGQQMSLLQRQYAFDLEFSAYSEEAMLKAIEDPTRTIGVMPSKVEPCGLFAAFLQAQGVPVMVSPAGGLRDIAGDSYALTFDSLTPEGMAASIKSLLGTENLNSDLSRMADRAFSRTQSLFSPSRLGRELEEKVYAPLLREGK